MGIVDTDHAETLASKWAANPRSFPYYTAFPLPSVVEELADPRIGNFAVNTYIIRTATRPQHDV